MHALFGRARRATVTVMVLTLVIGAIQPAPSAEAGRAARYEDSSTAVGCYMSGDAGAVSFFADVSSRWGGFFFVDYWAPGDDPEDESRWFGWSDDVSLSPDGSQLTATLEMEESGSGEVVADAVLVANLASDGEPLPVDDRFRDGNRIYRYQGWSQSLAATGSLSLPQGVAFELSDCWASTSQLSVFENNPTNRFSGTFVECEAETEEGTLWIYSFDEGDFAYADLFFAPADPGLNEISGFTMATFDGSAWSASFDLYEFFAQDPVGTAELEATLTATGEGYTYTIQGRGYRAKIWVDPLSVDGSVHISTDELDVTVSLDDAICRADDLQVVSRWNERVGPKPGGKVPVNDTLGGALSLGVPSVLNAQTRGASPLGEAETECLDYGDGFGVPMGYTLWYSVGGTGAPITLDTAGSDFDTVLAVYVVQDEELVEVACNDDVFLDPGYTRQAMLTLETEPGTTYYVQAGGWSTEEFGRLRIRTR